MYSQSNPLSYAICGPGGFVGSGTEPLDASYNHPFFTQGEFQFGSGRNSFESLTYMCIARAICFTLFWHCERTALSLALAKAGSSIAAKMAMMAITTSSSIRVNADGGVFVLLF